MKSKEEPCLRIVPVFDVHTFLSKISMHELKKSLSVAFADVCIIRQYNEQGAKIN